MNNYDKLYTDCFMKFCTEYSIYSKLIVMLKVNNHENYNHPAIFIPKIMISYLRKYTTFNKILLEKTYIGHGKITLMYKFV